MPLRNPLELPSQGKIAAFDVGEKTIGVAVCDALRIAASPRQTLKRSKWAEDKAQLAKLIAAEKLVAGVVGLPLNMDGSQGQSADRAQSFAHLLETELNLPVLLWDERLSTVAAESALFEQRTGRQTRASRKDVKQQVDSVAAALILQGVLDRLRG